MIMHTNETCIWFEGHEDGPCGEPVHHIERGGQLVRINTPHCEKHARIWSDLRATDTDWSMST
jgi:hypothetical protein